VYIYVHTHTGEAAEIFQMQLDNVYLFYHSNLLHCVNICYRNIGKENFQKGSNVSE